MFKNRCIVCCQGIWLTYAVGHDPSVRLSGEVNLKHTTYEENCDGYSSNPTGTRQ
jgi:hypothetical protein